MHDALLKDKQTLFANLAREAQICGLCPELHERTAVLSELNGNLNPLVMFIGEAPGRNGGDRTRRPFSGDASGQNFQKLIDAIDLKREDIFITNSVLCNPRKESGANRKPTRVESRNCNAFLRRQLDVLKPAIVATLGSVALEALKTIEYHDFSLRTTAGKICRWNDRLLIPLYHPSPQVLASHRRFDEQITDYRAVAQALAEIK